MTTFRGNLSIVAAVFVTAVGTTVLGGWILGVDGLKSIVGNITMKANMYTGIALPTALTFVVLAAGLLAARADCGPIAALTAPTPGGILARRLLVRAITLPLVLGYARVQGQRAGLYDTGLGTALFAIALAAIFVLLIWRTAVHANRVGCRTQEGRRGLAGERGKLFHHVQPPVAGVRWPADRAGSVRSP